MPQKKKPHSIEIEAMIREGKTNIEIENALKEKYPNITYSKVANIRHKMQKKEQKMEQTQTSETVPTETETEQVQVPEMQIEETPIIQDTVTLQEVKPEIRNELLSAKMGKKTIRSAIAGINKIVPSKYRLEEEAIDTIAELWESPINRKVGTLKNEDLDIWIAVIVTLMICTPKVGMAVNDFMTNKKNKQTVNTLSDIEVKKQ
jgi:uncharacterized protein with HEPN domain